MDISDIGTFSVSDSDRQPFRSTPKKKRVINGSTARGRIKSVSSDNTFEPLSESDKNATSSSNDSDEDSIKSESTAHSNLFLETLQLDDANLSSWEKWLIRKEKERRQHVLAEILLNKQKKLEALHLEEAKKVALHLADITHKIWMKSKNKEAKEQKKIKEQQEAVRKAKREDAREKLQNLSAEKFKLWKEKKRQEEQARKQEEELKAKLSLEEKLQRYELNKKAFQVWLKKSAKRPLPKHYTYGYVGGILIGYYDGTSPPEPSYCNPEPWDSSTDYCDSQQPQPLLY